MDQVKDFFADLRSPDPSIRFSVLSRLEDLTLNDEQQAVFRELLTREQEPGIRFHMQKVLARFEGGEPWRAGVPELADLLQKPDRDEIALALMLEAVRKPEAPAVLAGLRQAGWPGFSPQLLPSVLKFLKKFGSGEDVEAVAALCKHADTRVLSSAVEALEKLSPDRLREHIVPLLLNENCGIRSRAVRILHRYDQSEALRHFESMLFANSAAEKQAALFHSFFFPFKQIESLMLRFISVETDSELIKKAGLVFMANPDRQIPMRLLEARQACVGEKSQLIDTILKGVLQSLFMAGIVNAEPAQMLQVLETHFQEKRIRLYIDRFSYGLKSSEVETRLKSVLKLCELIRHGVEEPRELVEHFLAGEADQRVRQQARQFLESGSIQPESPAGKETRPTSLLDLQPEQRFRLYDSLQKENFAGFIADARLVLHELPVAEQVVVLASIERFATARETDLVVKFLDSDNSELMTAAIDALSVINPEALHPLLPQLIKHRFDEVKVAAIKVFALFDKKQAISLVEQMLHSIKPVQRSNAIFCLAHFDFASVSQILLNAVKNEADEENLQQIVAILRANPDEDVFYRVYIEARTGRSPRTSLYKDLYGELAKQIVATDPGKSEAALYASAEERLEEENRSRTQRSAYQLEKIQKIRQDSEKKAGVEPELIRFTLMVYGSGALLTAFIWFAFMAPSSTPKPVPAKKVAVVAKSSARTIKGVIDSVDPARRLVKLSESGSQNICEITFPESSGELPAAGSHFHGQVKVISDKNGLIRAELQTAF